MIFFVGNDGTIIKSFPEYVYQGSANTNTIYLIAPFAVNSQVTVAFKLPNGTWTSPVAMTQQQALSGIVDEQGNTFAGWTYALPNNITQYYGVLTVQFFFYSASAGVITATSAAKLTVAKGVPSVLPETPSEDVYEAILSNIAALQEQLNNGTFAARSLYAWNSTYTYGADEITFYPSIGEYGAFVQSLQGGNRGNPPYNSDGTLNSTWWKEVVNFNTITEDFFGEIKDQVSLAQGYAASSRTYAQQSAASASASENSASQSAQYAQTSGNYAASSSLSAFNAASNASASLRSANQSAQSAEDSAESANEAEDHAKNAATSASSSAESASQSAQSALESYGYMEQAKEYAQKEYQIYDSFADLPRPGDPAFIYLVPKVQSREYVQSMVQTLSSSGVDISNATEKELYALALVQPVAESDNDNYSEYIWVTNIQDYEFIGSINDIDLTDYAKIDGTYPDMTVGKAGQLSTPRGLQVDLESEQAVQFDGSQDVNIGVSGVLPVSHGGTGATDLSDVTVGTATNSPKSLYNLGAYDSYVDNGDGTVTVTRKTGYVIFNGDSSDGWHNDGSLHGYRISTNTSEITNAVANIRVIADSNAAYSHNQSSGAIFTTNGGTEGKISIYLYDSSITDLNTAKAWLSANPVFVEYETSTSYTETLPANVPINTLDAHMSDIVREEVEKTLNLADESGTYTIQSGTEHWKQWTIASTPNFHLENGKTYTVSIGNVPDGLIAQFYPGYYLIHNGRKYTFVYDSSILQYIRVGVANTPIDSDVNVTPQIMIVEGSNAYPYQPYNGAIVHDKQLNEALEDLKYVYSFPVGATDDPGSLQLDDPWLETHSYVGSAFTADVWKNLINIRHRGGEGDGNLYGLQISSNFGESLVSFRYQTWGNWSDWFNFANQDWVQDNYLPLTGGTINGNLNVTGEVEENGQRVYSPNNPPPVSHMYLHRISATFSTDGVVFFDIISSRYSVYTEDNIAQGLPSIGPITATGKYGASMVYAVSRRGNANVLNIFLTENDEYYNTIENINDKVIQIL